MDFNWLRYSFENGPEAGSNYLHGLMKLFVSSWLNLEIISGREHPEE